MKKARFFYEMNYFLIVLLGWLLLFNKAIEVNEKNKKNEKATFVKELPGIAGAGIALLKEGLYQEKIALQTKEAAAPLKATSCAAQKQIRVLLMDSDYQSYYHSWVALTVNGEHYEYTSDSQELQDQSLILEGGEDGIAVTSIRRQENPPVYYGTLEIRNTAQGLLLINELPLEAYLEGVVPSEMLSSYEEQALMAQAVCARTYAVRQMEEGSLQKEYKADVDDSVNFQVYGNIAPTEKTSKAVKETCGQIMCQNGEPVAAYYFSTSSGKTSTDEIWGVTPASYLKSVECSFDQNAPWSSWKVSVPWRTLEERAAALMDCEDLRGIQVTKKSDSGAVIGLQVVGEKGELLLEGEYEIREFLSPKGQVITEKNGSTVTGGSLLPSAYFELKVNKGDCVEITGGGFGHGVGMSQTAANEMAKEGYSWQEILEYFFRDITFEKY